MNVREILSCVVIIGLIAGCGGQQYTWQSIPWEDGTHSTEVPAVGRLETEEISTDVLVTAFTRRDSRYPQVEQSPYVLGVSVSWRNLTDQPLSLESNPIKVIDASRTLIQPLSPETVTYQLFGGRLREESQRQQLAALSQPTSSTGDSDLLSAALSIYSEVIRQAQKDAIVRDMYAREVTPHALYYQAFHPTELPPGVAATWTEYYPYTSDTLTVMMKGQRIEDGIHFSPFPPPPPTVVDPQPPTVVDPQQVRMVRMASGIFIVGAIVLVAIVASGS